MPRISTKNQVTIPVAALEEAGLHAGDHVVVEALDDGELRERASAPGLRRRLLVAGGAAAAVRRCVTHHRAHGTVVTQP